MPDKSPNFSIIMANYNNGHFITQAVNSVFAQIHDDWELIIVDDGSTDDSIAVIDTLVAIDDRIRFLKNDKNRGVGYTKRRAVEKSRGTIVAILDPDDVIIEDALAMMLKAFTENPSAVLCWSEYWLCNESLELLSQSSSEFKGDNTMGYLGARPGDIHAFWSFKRDAYDKTPGFSQSLRLAEDQDLFYRLEEVGATHHVNQPLYYYRHHEGSTSIRSNTAQASAFHILTMVAALKRRKPIQNEDVWFKQRQKVLEYYENFIEWGAPCIDVMLAARLHRSMAGIQRVGWAKSPISKSIKFRVNRFLKGND